MKILSEEKTSGRFYTPEFLVREILDFAGYEGGAVLRKHLIDNSCGDGAFLREAARRYCENFLRAEADLSALKTELETFLHGIEIDEKEAGKCRENLDSVASAFGLRGVRWDVRVADALCVSAFDGKMDFVVGNPPYVRIHNLRDNARSVKKFTFAQRGMTDLFIVFFEIGFKMLRERGRMVLITPSSWLSSKAGRALRDYVAARSNLSGVVDLEHFQAFEAMTYSLISLFENGAKKDRVDYFKFDEKKKTRRFVSSLRPDEFQIGGNFYFSAPETLDFLRKVKNKASFASAAFLVPVRVKNGFATLADEVFVADEFAFSAGTIDVVKASTGKWRKCIFPYDARGNAISLEEIREKNPPLFAYFMAHEKRLRDERTAEDKARWHLFGRAQALGDVGEPKFAINALLRNLTDIKLVPVPAGGGVYGGLYIIGDVDFSALQKAVFCDDFLRYVKALKNYKSGGYYTFSARDLELFLNYQLRQNSDGKDVFEGAFRLVH